MVLDFRTLHEGSQFTRRTIGRGLLEIGKSALYIGA